MCFRAFKTNTDFNSETQPVTVNQSYLLIGLICLRLAKFITLTVNSLRLLSRYWLIGAWTRCGRIGCGCCCPLWRRRWELRLPGQVVNDSSPLLFSITECLTVPQWSIGHSNRLETVQLRLGLPHRSRGQCGFDGLLQAWSSVGNCTFSFWEDNMMAWRVSFRLVM